MRRERSRTWPSSAPSGVRRRTSREPTRSATGSRAWDGRSSTSPTAGGWSRSRSPPTMSARPIRAHGRRLGPRRTRHGRRVDPLGRRGMAGRRSPRDRFVPCERRRPRRALRGRRRHGGAGCHLGRRRRGRSPRARHRLGRGAQRRTEAVAGQDRPGDGRLDRGDRRRLRSARGGARRSRRRHLRTVRHRDARPPRVRRDRRPGGATRSRATAWRSAARSSRRPGCSTRSSAGTGRPTSSTRSGSRTWGSAPSSFPFRWSVTSIGCGSRRRPRIARGGRSGTSTGSSIAGATGTTSRCRGNRRSRRPRARRAPRSRRPRSVVRGGLAAGHRRRGRHPGAVGGDRRLLLVMHAAHALSRCGCTDAGSGIGLVPVA